MKDIELKLISERMKNSRRSDRELSRATGVSQSTVSRIIKRLEKEGDLREYSAIPKLPKLGYEIIAVVFGRRDYENHPEINTQKARDSRRNIQVSYSARALQQLISLKHFAESVKESK